MSDPLEWLSERRQRPPLALRNVLDHPARSAIAIVGMGFAVVMVLLQLGFLEAVRVTARTNYSDIAFDLVLVSPDFDQFFDPGSFPRDRLRLAEQLDTVTAARPLYTRMDLWRCPTPPPDAGLDAGDPFATTPPPNTRVPRDRNHPVALQLRALLVLGVELDRPPYGGPIGQAIDRHLGALRLPGRVLFNARSNPEFGTRSLETFDGWELAGRRVEIAGTFPQIRSFGADASVLCDARTFAEGLGLLPRALRPSFGFLSVKPGTGPATKEALLARLPDDVTVLTRQELAAREANYWVNQTATGIIFRFGVAVTILVAAVVIYQVLANDVRNRLAEYATLKAMGWPNRTIAAVVLRQAAIYAAAAFVPASLLAYGLYRITERLAGIPMVMTPGNLLLVLLLTLSASLVSGTLAVRKLRSADPADLL
jgi:putative ABC transport system permease protein